MFRYFSLVYGLYLCFPSTRLAWWLINKNVILFCCLRVCLRFICACLLVLYLYACTVENPKISGFCVSKSRGLRTDHKRVKNIKTQCCSVTQTSFLTAIIQRTFDKVFKVYFNSEHDLSFDHFLSILKTMTIFFVNKKKNI